MCDDSPTRRHPALIPLSHDHQHGLVVARRLRRAVTEGERLDAAQEFVGFVDGVGGEHFREEEDLLFPLVAAVDDSPLVERATGDHLHFRAAAVRLRRTPDPAAEALQALGGRLDAHIRLEERELFPLAERVVSDADLEAMQLAERAPSAAGIDAAALDGPGQGTLWSIASADLNATVLAWPAGEGVAEHTNRERDVLLVVVGGDGTIVIDGRQHALRAPELVLIPRGAARGVTAGAGGLRYVSVHLRRRGLVELRRRPAG